MMPLVRELRVSDIPSTSGPLLRLGGPAHAAEILRRRLEQEPVGVVLVLLLNTKNRLLGIHEVGRGTLDCCIVHPRDVFKVALLANASGVIVGHNHPSGEPEPSADDMALCARLRSAGSIVGIELLDFHHHRRLATFLVQGERAMRAALYARVSTNDQVAENQLLELRRYATARGWEATEFVDRGVSGSKDRRPALDALMDGARKRKIDVVVCWRLDRFGQKSSPPCDHNRGVERGGCGLRASGREHRHQ